MKGGSLPEPYYMLTTPGWDLRDRFRTMAESRFDLSFLKTLFDKVSHTSHNTICMDGVEMVDERA